MFEHCVHWYAYGEASCLDGSSKSGRTFRGAVFPESADGLRGSCRYFLNIGKGSNVCPIVVSILIANRAEALRRAQEFEPVRVQTRGYVTQMGKWVQSG